MSKKQQKTPSKSRHPRERRHTITGLDVALLAHCSSSQDKRLFLRYLIEHLEDSYSHYRDERRADEEKQSEERHQEALVQLRDLLKRAPAGMLGKPYHHHIVLPQGMVITQVKTTDDISYGIRFDLQDNQLHLTGTPIEAGTLSLQFDLHYHWEKNTHERVQPFTKQLLVNVDPRSLWKDIPTVKDIEYYKDDYGTDSLDLGKLSKSVIAASKRGRSHAHEGKPRDDDFSIHYDEASSWYLLLVADGAGSAPYSREGSRLAADRVKTTFCKASEDGQLSHLAHTIQSHIKGRDTSKLGGELYKLLGDMVFKAKQAIEEEARAKGREAKQYATTLLFSICKRFESGYFIASFWIGDGAICLLEDGKATLMGQPDSGEYAGQTRFLTNHALLSSFEDVMRRISYRYVNDFKALILMTDGVSDPKLETDALLQSTEAWNGLWQELQQGLKLQADISVREASMQLLQWLDFWSTGNHDDRTIAILY